ncbi:MAG: hypothetical protein EXS55_02690 [Candidatus Magasanikbacteria bacterium]|nr:hypothetical protein [Candidatus Magasanikbacteria bacterium]
MLFFLRRHAWQGLAIFALLAWYIFFLAHPIFLTPADIGRHITNGRLLVTTSLAEWGPLLHTNFYSYTFSEAPFINHHWGSGLIFYAIWKIGGFVGISILGLILNIIAFLLSFDLARRLGGWRLATLLGFLVIPLLAERAEVRPELFSYIFILLFVWLIMGVRDGRLKKNTLYILPIIELLWVNLHIYFFLGFVVVGAFWIETFLRREHREKRGLLTTVGLLMVLGGAINPALLRGFFYPFQIFNNYGLPVSENQSVATVLAQQPGDRSTLLFILLLGSFLVAVAGTFLKKRAGFLYALAIITGVFGLLGWLLVRNLALFTLIAFPTIVGLTALWRDPPKNAVLPSAVRRWLMAGGLAIFFTIVFYWPRWPTLLSTRGLGLLTGMGDAAAFINNHNIQGPLFNDFDSGSYVIFYLYPRVQPFVDNRAEAYPASFFKNTYVPMHVDNVVWLATENQYHFNAILYSFDDHAPYALPFILERLLDPAWAPVYTDKFSIIFLKRNEQNATLIKQFEIPKDKFSLQNE